MTCDGECPLPKCIQVWLYSHAGNMKNIIILVLATLVAFLADRVVRLENQRYAMEIGMCARASYPGGLQLPDPKCLETVQTRTSWLWHLRYAMDHVSAVPLWSGR